MWRLLLVALCVGCASAETLRFFVHIPKTGGTTFRHIFAQDCNRTWTFLANAPGTAHDISLIRTLLIENYTCFQGHMSWELVDIARRTFTEHNISTFVLLREPVDRLISQYYYEQTIFDTNYEAEEFMALNANTVARYLGEDAIEVVRSRATYVGLTGFYHETLSYLLAVGFLNNYDAVVNYNMRKVHQRRASVEVRGLAVEYTDKDRIIYGEAQGRFFDQQLGSIGNSTLYTRALHDLNSLPHVCKSDDAGIGSGRCW